MNSSAYSHTEKIVIGVILRSLNYYFLPKQQLKIDYILLRTFIEKERRNKRKKSTNENQNRDKNNCAVTDIEDRTNKTHTYT